MRFAANFLRESPARFTSDSGGKKGVHRPVGDQVAAPDGRVPLVIG
jgi:hypothetical protein